MVVTHNLFKNADCKQGRQYQMKSAKNNAQVKALPFHEYKSEIEQERKAGKHKRAMRKAKRSMWQS
jgi:hypothetical protein